MGQVTRLTEEGLAGIRAANRKPDEMRARPRNRHGRYMQRLARAGKCRHCGQPCAPYSECEERRKYVSRWRKKRRMVATEAERERQRETVRRWYWKDPAHAREVIYRAQRRQQIAAVLVTPEPGAGRLSRYDQDLDRGNAALSTRADLEQRDARIDCEALIATLTPDAAARLVRAIEDDDLESVGDLIGSLRQARVMTEQDGAQVQREGMERA